MASMSIFPLTYLGNSLLQQTRDDELETIYELLFTQYLNFLRRVIADEKTIGETLSESFQTVIIAIGNGQFTIRTTETERFKDQKFRKHFERRFTSDQLIYFNCYYFEVVTPMGRDERKCYAYFRRAIDTRRCVPEDALVQLDVTLSQWLLRNRHLTRPPLIYCIVANQEMSAGLDCHVFLADTVQVGLRVVRCLAELRQLVETTPAGLNVPRLDKRYHSPHGPHCTQYDVNFCAYCGEPLDSSSSTSDSDGKKRRLLQMKLGQEALDYYERRKRLANHVRHSHSRYHRDRSVPANIEQRIGRMNLTEQLVRSKNHVSDVPGRVSSCPHHRPVGSASSKSSHTFLDSSLSLLP
ncbi:unnamed protein product [Echinostoma caproni]|uniref:Nuclear receptor domain-containing protein n=1 Tax=Echinostoma caproni TaxID=27848 RepID=A0A183A7E0_9TREM|nr:unnamed protein product [Echinostoma caproni]